MKAPILAALCLLLSLPAHAAGRWVGGVTARVQINAEGTATSIEFDGQRDGDLTPRFREMLMERLRRVEFEPALVDGRAVSSETSLYVLLGVDEGPNGFGPLAIDSICMVPGYRKVSPPRYPNNKLRRGLEGHVVVELAYDADGRVTEAEVVDAARADRDFARAALNAARQWEFEPQKVDGKPVPGTATVPVYFTLGNGSARGDSEVAVLRFSDGSRLQVVKEPPAQDELADSVVGVRSIDKAREPIND
jgi:TonB family protein